jgi:hypothetical protein
MLTSAQIEQFAPRYQYQPQPHIHIERAVQSLLVLASKARKDELSTGEMIPAIDVQIQRLQHLKIQIRETIL